MAKVEPDEQPRCQLRLCTGGSREGGRVSDCCVDVADALTSCPRCGTPGSVIGEAPVRAHRPIAPAGSWRYCANPVCDAVFFLDTDVVAESEVVGQVGRKALSHPIPICFCFAHTGTDIRIDVATHDGRVVPRLST